MADRSVRLTSPIQKIRVTARKLFRPDDLAEKVVNMYPTEEGTLRSVRGPAPYLPDYASAGAPNDGSAAVVATPVYGRTKGIFHGRFQGGAREVLLLHTGDQLWEFEGWNRAWRMLIGPTTASGGPGVITDDLEDIDRPDFPTMFVSTPTGVVIIPQNRRAYFYDGTVILPLGYAVRPSPPTPRGPRSSDTQLRDEENEPGVNDRGYAHDGLPRRNSGMALMFKEGRLGLTVHPTNYAGSYESTTGKEGDVSATIVGWLEPGEWRTVVQWVDYFGNLSPLSDGSDPVKVERQMATGWNKLNTQSVYVRVDLARKQIAWEGISPGREGTIGRIIGRTRDIRNTGDAKFYELPLNAFAANGVFATLPDNETRIYPDNIPDSWLVSEMMEVDPVPNFKIATLAFGRLWIANWPGGAGSIRPSDVGRWGTFPSNKEMIPDPSASEITGLHACNRGLLAFTSSSTYLIEANDLGDDFRSMPLSTRSGCAAPDSIDTNRDGLSIWLGRDGFYAFQGGVSESPQYIFESHRVEVREFNQPRLREAVGRFDDKSGEYRCWVPIQGKPGNVRCYTFDGEGWRHRTDVTASGATVTRDHRRMMITCGKQEDSTDGVWIQDVETPEYSPLARTHSIETGWISSEDSRARTSLRRVYLWLRETQTSANTTPATDKQLTVEVFRDWRETVVATSYVELRAKTGVQPEYWNVVEMGSTVKWRRNRPFWTKVDFSLPSCEVFKVKLSTSENWEFCGMQFDVGSRDTGGANLPP